MELGGNFIINGLDLFGIDTSFFLTQKFLYGSNLYLIKPYTFFWKDYLLDYNLFSYLYCNNHNFFFLLYLNYSLPNIYLVWLKSLINFDLIIESYNIYSNNIIRFLIKSKQFNYVSNWPSMLWVYDDLWDAYLSRRPSNFFRGWYSRIIKNWIPIEINRNYLRFKYINLYIINSVYSLNNQWHFNYLMNIQNIAYDFEILLWQGIHSKYEVSKIFPNFYNNSYTYYPLQKGYFWINKDLVLLNKDINYFSENIKYKPLIFRELFCNIRIIYKKYLYRDDHIYEIYIKPKSTILKFFVKRKNFIDNTLLYLNYSYNINLNNNIITNAIIKDNIIINKKEYINIKYFINLNNYILFESFFKLDNIYIFIYYLKSIFNFLYYFLKLYIISKNNINIDLNYNLNFFNDNLIKYYHYFLLYITQFFNIIIIYFNFITGFNFNWKNYDFRPFIIKCYKSPYYTLWYLFKLLVGSFISIESNNLIYKYNNLNNNFSFFFINFNWKNKIYDHKFYFYLIYYLIYLTYLFLFIYFYLFIIKIFYKFYNIIFFFSIYKKLKRNFWRKLYLNTGYKGGILLFCLYKFAYIKTVRSRINLIIPVVYHWSSYNIISNKYNITTWIIFFKKGRIHITYLTYLFFNLYNRFIFYIIYLFLFIPFRLLLSNIKIFIFYILPFQLIYSFLIFFKIFLKNNITKNIYFFIWHNVISLQNKFIIWFLFPSHFFFYLTLFFLSPNYLYVAKKSTYSRFPILYSSNIVKFFSNLRFLINTNNKIIKNNINLLLYKILLFYYFKIIKFYIIKDFIIFPIKYIFNIFLFKNIFLFFFRLYYIINFFFEIIILYSYKNIISKSYNIITFWNNIFIYFYNILKNIIKIVFFLPLIILGRLKYIFIIFFFYNIMFLDDILNLFLCYITIITPFFGDYIIYLLSAIDLLDIYKFNEIFSLISNYDSLLWLVETYPIVSDNYFILEKKYLIFKYTLTSRYPLFNFTFKTPYFFYYYLGFKKFYFIEFKSITFVALKNYGIITKLMYLLYFFWFWIKLNFLMIKSKFFFSPLLCLTKITGGSYFLLSLYYYLKLFKYFIFGILSYLNLVWLYFLPYIINYIFNFNKITYFLYDFYLYNFLYSKILIYIKYNINIFEYFKINIILYLFKFIYFIKNIILYLNNYLNNYLFIYDYKYNIFYKDIWEIFNYDQYLITGIDLLCDFSKLPWELLAQECDDYWWTIIYFPINIYNDNIRENILNYDYYNKSIPNNYIIHNQVFDFKEMYDPIIIDYDYRKTSTNLSFFTWNDNLFFYNHSAFIFNNDNDYLLYCFDWFDFYYLFINIDNNIYNIELNSEDKIFEIDYIFEYDRFVWVFLCMLFFDIHIEPIIRYRIQLDFCLFSFYKDCLFFYIWMIYFKFFAWLLIDIIDWTNIWFILLDYFYEIKIRNKIDLINNTFNSIIYYNQNLLNYNFDYFEFDYFVITNFNKNLSKLVICKNNDYFYSFFIRIINWYQLDYTINSNFIIYNDNYYFGYFSFIFSWWDYWYYNNCNSNELYFFNLQQAYKNIIIFDSSILKIFFSIIKDLFDVNIDIKLIKLSVQNIIIIIIKIYLNLFIDSIKDLFHFMLRDSYYGSINILSTYQEIAINLLMNPEWFFETVRIRSDDLFHILGNYSNVSYDQFWYSSLSSTELEKLIFIEKSNIILIVTKIYYLILLYLLQILLFGEIGKPNNYFTNNYLWQKLKNFIIKPINNNNLLLHNSFSFSQLYNKGYLAIKKEYKDIAYKNNKKIKIFYYFYNKLQNNSINFSLFYVKKRLKKLLIIKLFLNKINIISNNYFNFFNNLPLLYVSLYFYKLNLISNNNIKFKNNNFFFLENYNLFINFFTIYSTNKINNIYNIMDNFIYLYLFKSYTYSFIQKCNIKSGLNFFNLPYNPIPFDIYKINIFLIKYDFYNNIDSLIFSNTKYDNQFDLFSIFKNINYENYYDFHNSSDKIWTFIMKKQMKKQINDIYNKPMLNSFHRNSLSLNFEDINVDFNLDINLYYDFNNYFKFICERIFFLRKKNENLFNPYIDFCYDEYIKFIEPLNKNEFEKLEYYWIKRFINSSEEQHFIKNKLNKFDFKLIKFQYNDKNYHNNFTALNINTLSYDIFISFNFLFLFFFIFYYSTRTAYGLTLDTEFSSSAEFGFLLYYLRSQFDFFVYFTTFSSSFYHQVASTTRYNACVDYSADVSALFPYLVDWMYLFNIDRDPLFRYNRVFFETDNYGNINITIFNRMQEYLGWFFITFIFPNKGDFVLKIIDLCKIIWLFILMLILIYKIRFIWKKIKIVPSNNLWISINYLNFVFKYYNLLSESWTNYYKRRYDNFSKR